MGKFTALDDPLVDEVVSCHMQKIVATVRSHMKPDAILLRGSFGRREGSVIVENTRLRFLSDYEIDVATYSPFYRKLFSHLSGALTTELGVETSLAWVRPDYLYKLRVGPFIAGAPPTTISLYERRYGSQILYGRDILTEGPVIDASRITLSSAIKLILNRMAESLQFLPENRQDDLQSVIWANKLILACIEALLVAWGQYHFSYEERGRRFFNMARGRLDFMRKQESIFLEFANRAVEFKLRPRRNSYPQQLNEIWLQVISMCDLVFRQLVCQAWNISISDYAEFPRQYLAHGSNDLDMRSIPLVMAIRLLDAYKHLRNFPHALPLRCFRRETADQITYSVVPLLFVGWNSLDETFPSLISVVRQNLGTITVLGQPASNPREEWKRLNKIMFQSWKNFCA